MAIFRNDSNQILKLMVNGSRISVIPGQTIHGPETLNSVVGLKMVSKNLKINVQPQKVSSQQDIIKKQDYPIANYSNGMTDSSIIINRELEYHQTFLDKGEMPSVTIAILTKNAFQLIKNCCESILDKVNYRELTIMICDTGTTDQNVFKYYDFLEISCKNKNINFNIVKLPFYHFSKNYNEVAKHISTDYFLIQNNDTVALNDYVSKMMEIAILNKTASVGPRMFYPDRRIQHDGQFIFDPNGECNASCGHLNLGSNKASLPPEQTCIKQVDGNTAAGCLIRTSDFSDIGGFDEAYKDIFQDVDLMIKLGQIDNRFNFCDRYAEIVHIDNASRMGVEKTAQRHMEMQQDMFYLKKKSKEMGWRRKSMPKYNFSIITLAYNIENYKKLLNSLRIQEGVHSIEIIGIPNYHNSFKSIFEAYNRATEVASGEILIYCHDDIIVPNDWLKTVRDVISNLELNKVPWGVLGPAGVQQKADQGIYFLLNDKMKPTPESLRAFTPIEVTSLDELCLITKKSNNLKFSENDISGFHFYGVDLCTTAKLAGLKNLSAPLFCHHSSDGMKNLDTVDKFSSFIEKVKEWDRLSRKRGLSEWRTTTSKAENNKIVIYSTPEVVKKEIGGYKVLTVS